MKTDSRDSKKSAKANLQASSGYLKRERSNGKLTVDRYVVDLAKCEIIMCIYDDNPLEMAAETIGTARGGITESELDEAINAATRELAEAAGLHDFLEPDMFRPDDREMIIDAKGYLGWPEDPVAEARDTLRILHKTASESEREEALRIARKEYEFQQKVDQYYKGLDKEDQDKLRLADQ